MSRISAKPTRDKSPHGGFTVPDEYFDGFADRLQERLPQNGSNVRTLWLPRLGWVAAAAAAILLLVFMPDRQGAGIEFEDLSGESIASYLESKDGDLSTQDLAEALPLDEIALQDMLDGSLETKQIADYLENDNEMDDEFYWEDDE